MYGCLFISIPQPFAGWLFAAITIPKAYIAGIVVYALYATYKVFDTNGLN